MPPPVTRQEQQQQQQQQHLPAPNMLNTPRGGVPAPKPQMSQEKRLEVERYLNMTRGQFLPMSRPR